MKIILIEDHPIYAKGLIDILTVSDWEIHWAKDFVDFIENISKIQFDLALVDLMLSNGKDGFDVCHELQKNSPETKIIILSAFDNTEFIKKVKKLNNLGYVAKSDPLEELQKAIESVMAGKPYFSNKLRQQAARKTSFLERNSIEIKDIFPNNLSSRELQILESMVYDDDSDQILSEKFELTIFTIRDYKRKIYRKLDVKNLAGAMRFYHKHLNAVIKY